MAVYRLIALVVLTTAVVAEPAPGRIPKVYNALITSNQNLEPSKAYPVYQPVLHDAFAYPYQPVFYGDIPLTNNLLPPPVAGPKNPEATQPVSAPSEAPKEEAPAAPPAESASPPAESAPAPSEQDKAANEPSATSAPPQPPKTESPIPLNQFGLPPQVLPLGRIDPAYNGFNQVGPFTSYPYPSFRFYDPYDPFSYNPYLNLPPPSLYRPLPNFISQGAPGVPQGFPGVLRGLPGVPQGLPGVPQGLPAVPQGAPEEPSKDNDIPSAPDAESNPEAKVDNQNPPSEPDNLSVLNYESKDPSIPNVPPPPLPEGGLKSDDTK